MAAADGDGIAGSEPEMVLRDRTDVTRIEQEALVRSKEARPNSRVEVRERAGHRIDPIRGVDGEFAIEALDEEHVIERDGVLDLPLPDDE